jgi:hypothetical protein
LQYYPRSTGEATIEELQRIIEECGKKGDTIQLCEYTRRNMNMNPIKKITIIKKINELLEKKMKKREKEIKK